MSLSDLLLKINLFKIWLQIVFLIIYNFFLFDNNCNYMIIKNINYINLIRRIN